MPRQSRIDEPGALHHIIARGIERKWKNVMLEQWKDGETAYSWRGAL